MNSFLENENIKMTRVLPLQLQAAAVILLNEWSWPRESGLKVVEWSEEFGWPILGVEIWHRVGDVPKWIATFSCPDIDGTRVFRAHASAIHATNTINLYADDPLALFNIAFDFDEFEM